MSSTTHYPGNVDWATICRWNDAGRPALNPDGTWDEQTPTPSHEEIEQA
jgi:hypothetical protein